ncbi:hypothetical protein GSI_04488 [Ganoderma sinense ZZ0214-1]|uniref:Uncharacterized protein n=1 Tax=Ganoderma sinense ZZ0214-1 TaxID=1077348 RepID=A0A2G8SGY3_9APHY|nr:hypothetical protein GSI_04488 [Ganoderma sinense ZZ0214-1]
MPPRGVAEGLKEPLGYLDWMEETPSGALTTLCVSPLISLVGRNVASVNGTASEICCETDQEVVSDTGKRTDVAREVRGALEVRGRAETVDASPRARAKAVNILNIG